MSIKTINVYNLPMSNNKDILAPIDQLHQKSMELADVAFYANRKGENKKSEQFYREAFQYEKAAAMLLLNEYTIEPSRAILFRSAACLLLNIATPTVVDYREAERMAAFALAGNPPEGIIPELWEILVECHENRVKTPISTLYPTPQLETLLAYLTFKGWSVEELEQGQYKIIRPEAKGNIEAWLLKKEDLPQQFKFLRFLARFEGLQLSELMDILKKNLTEIKQEIDWKQQLLKQGRVV